MTEIWLPLAGGKRQHRWMRRKSPAGAATDYYLMSACSMTAELESYLGSENSGLPRCKKCDFDSVLAQGNQST